MLISGSILGMAAKSVGASALGAAASQVGNVKDTSSAKRAAASVGRAAVSDRMFLQWSI